MALLSDLPREVLASVTTATITTLLLKQAIRSTWMRGPKPLNDGQDRIVGEAFTLRLVPMREELATPQSWAGARSTRDAIEEMPHGSVAVVDAMGLAEAGIFGDIPVPGCPAFIRPMTKPAPVMRPGRSRPENDRRPELESGP